MKKAFTFIFLCVFAMMFANAQKPVHTITDATGTVTWGDTAVYLLNGLVFVEDGDTLTIEEGVIIKGAPGQEESASALVVAKGGTIIANGTAANPIVFTAQVDTITSPSSQSNIPTTTRGLWGGLIILGNGVTNQTGASAIEGIPTDEPRGSYGSDSPEADQSSGSLKYVSIRHGGTDIGEGNEINGLTLGAVGSGTTISYVEVVSNKDDGIEWFGGAPKCDHILVSFCADDSYDYDQGFSGMNQFMVAIQDTLAGDRLGEHDGGDENETGRPFAHPVFSNVTYIGAGADAGTRLITFRDNAGGEYRNSIFFNQAKGIDIEDLTTDQDSWERFESDSIVIANNVFWNIADNDTAAVLTISAYEADKETKKDPTEAQVLAVKTHFVDNMNHFVNPGVSMTDPVPATAQNDTSYVGMDSFFQKVGYQGAFGSTNWAANWTLTFATRTVVPENTVYVFDNGTGVGDDNSVNEKVVWDNETVWVLNGFVFVNAGDTLEIEPGTIVKGAAGQEESASALIVANGGYIKAVGTADAPIIFTAAADELDGTIPNTTRGLWGGIIILGNGVTNQTGSSAIEGIPTSEPRGSYGSDSPVAEHSSGILKYVSIRHGGTDIGEGNEINGLTLGACGTGTTISFVEILANKDDGVEWFGGAPRCDHIIAAYCADDSYDYDQGFSGYNQFLVAIQDADACDRLGEHDGGDENETGRPFAHPVFSNVTYIGAGADAGKRLITFRDNAGGEYRNSIFFNQAKGIDIEDLTTDQDSWERFESDSIVIANNIFWNIADNDTAKLLTVSAYEADKSTAKDPTDDQVAAVKQHLIDNNNKIVDPGITVDNPTLANNYEIADFTAMNSWFTVTTYVGAFEPDQNWALGWTESLGDVDAQNAVKVGVFNYSAPSESVSIYPNPFASYFRIDLEENTSAVLRMYDVTGKQVKVVNVMNSNESIDCSDLRTGLYTYSVEIDGKFAYGKALKR